MSVGPDQIQTLYDTTLKPRLDKLEHLRVSIKGYIAKGVASVLVPFLIFQFGDVIAVLLLPPSAAMAFTVGSFLLIFAGVIFAGTRYLLPGVTAYINYTTRFKRDVVSEIFKIVCPTGTYNSMQGIAQDIFVGSGVFDDQGSYHTDDRVRGRIGQTPFEAAEVKRQYSTGGKNSTTRTVFQGLFFHLDFNKNLSGVTYIQPEAASSYQIGDRRGMTLVNLENPDFEKEFKVYSTNEVEARYILTPAMMERLLTVRRQANHPVFLGFKGNRAYLGVHYHRALFEPGLATTTSLESIQEMARNFALAELVVNELDLNTRIWTKGVDDSLLHAPDESPAESLMQTAAARDGNLTEAGLWEMATTAVGMAYADDKKAVPRPDKTLIAIDHRPDGTTVRYELSFTFFFCFTIAAACAVACLSALRLLGESGDLGPIAPLTSWLPAIPPVDDLLRSAPIVWLLGGAFIGSFFTLGWVFHVRRVEIAADVIRVYRGLRPFARRYPRPPYNLIVGLDNSVHLGREGGINLINPSASPMLSKEEARWVASEMRRALRQTARAQ